ncbi:hypothetical protein AWA2013_32440 (plasmid) [Lactiplantibacillus plantarum]|nr:hypothetical protein AWA2013_32440 [Lactiplantibacillus plantarum]
MVEYTIVKKSLFRVKMRITVVSKISTFKDTVNNEYSPDLSRILMRRSMNRSSTKPTHITAKRYAT